MLVSRLFFRHGKILAVFGVVLRLVHPGLELRGGLQVDCAVDAVVGGLAFECGGHHAGFVGGGQQHFQLAAGRLPARQIGVVAKRVEQP